MKRKLRIGIRISKLFPNVGIFVIDVPFAIGFEIIENFRMIKKLMITHDPDLAEKLVCEWREI